MSDIRRRLEKLEEQLTPPPCICHTRPVRLRTDDDPPSAAEPPAICPTHGEVGPLEIVIVSLQPIDQPRKAHSR